MLGFFVRKEIFITSIVSLKILGITLAVAVLGSVIMTVVVRRKYECTPKREKELEKEIKDKE